jgi:hypothetical protein
MTENTENITKEAGQPNKLAQVESEVKNLNKTLWYVTVALAVGFIAVLVAVISPVIDAVRFRSSSYEQLNSLISAQNAKIDLLYLQCTNQNKPTSALQITK